MPADAINGLLELGGGAFIALSCAKLYRDKRVRGVSLWHSAYFTAWGFWNLYFYPAYGAWLSFVGGIGVVALNSLWLGMMAWYLWRERHE